MYGFAKHKIKIEMALFFPSIQCPPMPSSISLYLMGIGIFLKNYEFDLCRSRVKKIRSGSERHLNKNPAVTTTFFFG